MIEQINGLGRMWWRWMWPMFWQVGVVVVLVWMVDLVLRRRVWPQVRYALWFLVLVKLILPPWLAAPTSVTCQLAPLATEAVRYRFPADESAVGPRAEQVAPAVPGPTDLDALAINPPVTGDIPTGAGFERPVRDAVGAVDSAGRTDVAEERGPRLEWESWAMLIWLIGVVTLVCSLARRFRRLRRRYAKKGSSELPARFEQLLGEAAKKLRLPRLPEVVMSREVVSPAVFGVFRPVLLMPAGEVRRLCRRELEHVLLHELAHVKRGDVKVHAFYMVLQIIYWFNPLLWLIRRQLQHLRELCCDATVARILREETSGYRETILQTARRMLTRPAEPGLGLLGLFEDSARLVTRLKWLEKKTWRHRGLRIATVFIIVAVMATCVLPMAKSSAAAFRVAGGPLDIQLVGVRPDGGDEIYDANGKRIAEDTFANTDARWSKYSQYRTFIFELPAPDDQLLFPPFLRVTRAGGKHSLSTTQRPRVYYSDGKLTYSVGVTFPRTYKKWFTRRINEVDLTLRYYYGPRGKADFVFEGPFTAGQTVKVQGGADCQLTTKEDRLNFSNHPAAFFKVYSKSRFDGKSVLVYDTWGRRHLPEGERGHDGKDGSSHSYRVEGLTLDSIAYVTVGEKLYERTFENVVVSYRGRPARERMEYLDQICERLGLSGLTDEQLYKYNFENPAEAIKVMDIVRGLWHVRKAFEAVVYAEPKLDISTLDEASREKIRAAAKRWSEAGDPWIGAAGIQLGLYGGWPEFLDAALDVLESDERIWEMIGPGYGYGQKWARREIASSFYRGPVKQEQVARIKEIIFEDRNPATTKYLLDLLGHTKTDAAFGACWDLAGDNRPWVWWPAISTLLNRCTERLRPFGSLSDEMLKRLILIEGERPPSSPLFKISASGKDYETLAGEAYSVLPGLYTPKLAQMSGSLCHDVQERLAAHLERDQAEEVMVEFLRGILTPPMQRLWAEDNAVFHNCCVESFYIARQFNRWYGVNIGSVGTTYEEHGEPIPHNIADLKALIAETLQWYDGRKVGVESEGTPADGVRVEPVIKTGSRSTTVEVFKEYCQAGDFLFKGGDRGEAAERYRAIARRSPETDIGKISGELAEMLRQMAAEDKEFQRPEDVNELTVQQRIDYYVYKLRDVAEQALFTPGNCNVISHPRTPESAAVALRRIGKPAVPVLIGLLEDRRPTRSVPGSYSGSYVLRYCDAALQILEIITGQNFGDLGVGDGLKATGVYLSNTKPQYREQIISRVKRWWAENSSKSEAEWIRGALSSRGIGMMWDRIQIAERLIELEGKDSVEFFRERLEKEPANAHAVALLWKAGGKEVVEDIRPKMEHKDFYVRSAAYRALMEAGEAGVVDRVIREIGGALERADEKPDYHRTLIYTLIRSDQDRGVLAAARLVRHRNPVVAESALTAFQTALARENKPSEGLRCLALPFMAEALGNEELGHWARWWLANARDPSPGESETDSDDVLKVWWQEHCGIGAGGSGTAGGKVEVDTSRAEVMAVIESLAEELERIAPNYPELSEYRKDAAKHFSDGDWRLSYRHNFTAPRAKRRIRPSDFGENGFYVYFHCKAMAPPGSPKYAMPPPRLTLWKLRAYLWAEVKTGPSPSPGLVDEVQSLLDAHAEKLRQVDEKVSGRPNQVTSGKREVSVQEIMEVSQGIVKSIYEQIADIEPNYPALEGFAANANLETPKNLYAWLHFSRDMGPASKSHPYGILKSRRSCRIDVRIQNHKHGQMIGRSAEEAQRGYPLAYRSLRNIDVEILIEVHAHSDALSKVVSHTVLAALRPLIKLDEEAGAEVGPHVDANSVASGQAVEGLQLGLSMDRGDGVYRQGELVTLTVYVRNTSKTERTVTYYVQADGGKSPAGEHPLRDKPRFTNDQGEPVLLRRPIRGADVVIDQKLLLGPGETQTLGIVRVGIKPILTGQPVEYSADLGLGVYRTTQSVNLLTQPMVELPAGILQLHTGELEFTVLPSDLHVQYLSAWETGRFGSEVSKVLSLANGQAWIDFDTGRTMDEPAGFRPEVEGMDAAVEQDQIDTRPSGLRGLGLRMIAVPNKRWNARPSTVAEELSQTAWPKSFSNIPAEDLPSTFFVETQQGGMGVIDKDMGLRGGYFVITMLWGFEVFGILMLRVFRFWLP